MTFRTGTDIGPGGSRHWVQDSETGNFVSTDGTPWGAWEAIAFKRFVDSGEIPVATPAGLFETKNGPSGRYGYSSDPAQARTLPMHMVNPQRLYLARLAARKFIHANTSTNDSEVFAMSDEDYFEHDPGQYESDLIEQAQAEDANAAQAEADAIADMEGEFPATDAEPEGETEPESPAETPETPAEPLSGDDGATTPEDAREAARAALSDSDRNAFDNYADLAADAPSEGAREFWQAMADAILKVDA